MVWVMDILRMYFVFLALNANVSFAVILTVIVVTALIGFLPLLPGGLALIESTMIIIYAASGIGLVIAGLQTILDRLISYWMVTFAGLSSAYRLGFTQKLEVNNNEHKQSTNKRTKKRKTRNNRR